MNGPSKHWQVGIHGPRLAWLAVQLVADPEQSQQGPEPCQPRKPGWPNMKSHKGAVGG